MARFATLTASSECIDLLNENIVGMCLFMSSPGLLAREKSSSSLPFPDLCRFCISVCYSVSALMRKRREISDQEEYLLIVPGKDEEEICISVLNGIV